MSLNGKHPPALALRPRDAARAIGVSERTLWDLTHRQNEIPYVQIGKSIRYRVASLEAYLAAHEKKVVAPTSDDPVN